MDKHDRYQVNLHFPLISATFLWRGLYILNAEVFFLRSEVDSQVDMVDFTCAYWILKGHSLISREKYDFCKELEEASKPVDK